MRTSLFRKSRIARDAAREEHPRYARGGGRLLVFPLLLMLILTVVSGAKVQCEKTNDLVAIAAIPGLYLPSPSEEIALAHIKYLASDELEGRATGEKGGYLAADYIARQFQKLGLLTPADAGLAPAAGGDTAKRAADAPARGMKSGGGIDGYLQRFDATVGVNLGEENLLKVSFPTPGGIVESTYACGEDFIPFSFSYSGSVLTSPTFAGYGISSEQYGYDDYANTTLNGNVALVMRHEPRETDTSSVFSGATLTHYSDLRYKATNARDHGASAVILTIDPLNHAADEDELIKLQSREGLGDCGIPAIQVKQHVADAMLRAHGLELARLQARIDSAEAPSTVALPGVQVTLRTDLVKDRRSVGNVVGILTPPGREVSEYVVVGAHYDHLGFGGESSLSKEGGIHNGADDNASGVSAMLELARILSAGRDSLKRGIVFISFVGEEIGVLGSSFYVDHPIVPLEKTVLMLNLDMVGRMREQKLLAAGVGSSPVIKELTLRVGAAPSGQSQGAAPLMIETSESGYGGSDHFPFYAKNVPVLFLFTGAHEDYHKVTDDWEKINVEGLSSVVELSARILAEVAFTDMPIPFTRAVGDTSGPPGGEGYGRGSGAHFGIVPDFGGEAGEGAKISGTSEGSPAEKAGLRAGDVIVKFAGKTITDLQDLSYALREKRPGDKVEVVVVREGKEIVFEATLASRGAK